MELASKCSKILNNEEIYCKKVEECKKIYTSYEWKNIFNNLDKIGCHFKSS